MSSKVYAVLLNEGSSADLGKVVAAYVKPSEFGDYIYAQKIDPNGNYFHMWLPAMTAKDDLGEVELQIPHRHIKAVFYAADIKKVGFK